ncbi:uncharacterized protein ACNS7B_012564 [Menidia menidia]
MDATIENISVEEMLETIAELDYSQSQLRGLNAEMRHWLDVADDDIATLRSENADLKKQVKNLEKIVSEAEEEEAEPCGSLLTEDAEVKRCREIKLRDLELESIKMKEQNKGLAAQIKSLEQERDQDKMMLSKLRDALRTLENEMEDVNLTLQQREEVIHQKSLKLKHLEDTVEECSRVIKDLRMTKQELVKQLEEKRHEASLDVQTEQMDEGDKRSINRLSIAEEIQLLDPPPDTMTSKTDIEELGPAEELLEPQSLPVDLNTESCATGDRCPEALKIPVLRAGLLMLCLFSFYVLACLALGCCTGDSEFFSSILWSSARLKLQPYLSVHYGTLPPI